MEGPLYWSGADYCGTQCAGICTPCRWQLYILDCQRRQQRPSIEHGADPAIQHESLMFSGWTGQYEWTKYTSQTSSPISLAAGKKYYIEVLHKQGTGGNLVAVAWQGPGITQQVIDGLYLSPYLYNFKDYSISAARWLKTNCSKSNAWCSGADRQCDGNVGFDDLMNFAQWWLLETN